MSFFEYWKNHLELWQKVLFAIGIVCLLTVFLPVTIAIIPAVLIIYLFYIIYDWFDDWRWM